MKKIVSVLLIAALLAGFKVSAQSSGVSLNGATFVPFGATESYSVSYNPNPWNQYEYPSVQWTVTGGTITYQNNGPSGAYCTIAWDPNATSGLVTAYVDYYSQTLSLNVGFGTIITVSGGGITTNYPFFNTANPTPVITEFEPASNCSGSFTYRWEHSYDGITWIIVGTGQNYPASAPALTQTTYIRRRATCFKIHGYTNQLIFTYKSIGYENRSYIKTNEVWYAGKTNFTLADNLPIGQKQQSTVFYDGLGRPEQTTLTGVSPEGKDLVTPIEYDPLGRETKKHLAYQASTNTGKFQPTAMTDQNSFMAVKYPGESRFYAETVLENSPLNRQKQVLAQGQNWGASGRGISTDYELNTAIELIRIWSIDDFGLLSSPTNNNQSYYPANTLYKVITTDENNKKIIEYRDRFNQVVLKKQQKENAQPNLSDAHGGWLCTYYVYDDFGRLRFVIPPKAVKQMDEANNWVISNDMAKGLCYSYSYDYKNRLIEKRVPDADPVYMVYDNRDRLVFSQDGNQKSGRNNSSNLKEWTFYLYDELNRQVASGIISESSNYTRQQMQAFVDNPSMQFGTRTISINTDVSETLEVFNPAPVFSSLGASISFASLSINNINYYDATNVTYITTTLPYASNFENIEPQIQTQRTRGFQIATKTKVLDGTANKYIKSTSVYDDKGRVLQTSSTNILGSTVILTNQFDFAGRIRGTVYKENKTILLGPGQSDGEYYTITSKFEFDHAGRSIRIKKQIHWTKGGQILEFQEINSGEKTVVEHVYDNLGQLITKKLAPGYPGINGCLEKLDYEYNIRGWMTGINKAYVTNSSASGNFFGMELWYDKAGNAGYNKLFYNGNVAGTAWKTRGDNVPRKFDYDYDNANRITKALFAQQNTSGAAWTKDKFDFSVENIRYDASGNIERMVQKGVIYSGIVPMDQMEYGYGLTSNKLQWVADDGGTTDYKLNDFTDKNTGQGNTDFYYDENGNLIQDKNKGVTSIKYNYLNLAELVTIPGKGTIRYIYDAAGNKMQKIVTDQTPITGTVITTTTYSGPISYYGADAQISFEEGKVRFTTINASTVPQLAFAFDYYIKDHLSNIRMVLTEENQVNNYPAATMEPGSAATEDKYYNITNRTDKPVELQNNSSYTERYGNKMSKLSTIGGNQRIGPSIILKVMAGDVLHTKTDYYYKENGTQVNTTSLLNDLVNNFLVHLIGGQAGVRAKGEAAFIGSSLNGSDVAGSLISGQNSNYVSNKPKAFISYIIFDEQLKAISKGTRQVEQPGPLQAPLVLNDISIPQNGWIYIFTNNESEQAVFFDNFQVTHNRGNILEENHYYPFGLTMKAISPRALAITPFNRIKFGNKELDSEEFSDGSGLELYDFDARNYDAQIGRWNSIDPMAEEYYNKSPYTYCANNPATYVDKDGRFLQWVLQYGINVGINVATQMITAYLFDPKVNSWGTAWDKVSIWQAMGEGAVDMIGTKKLRMVANAAMQMMTYIDDVGFRNVTAQGLLLNGLIGILEPIVGDALGKYGIKRVEAGLQKMGIDGKTINKLIGRKEVPAFCFVAGTKILIEGGYIEIEKIKVGNYVWAYNDTTGVQGIQRVINTSIKTATSIIVIEVGSEIIITTPDHPFWLSGKWVEAKEIKIGDFVTLFNKKTEPVKSLLQKDTIIKVYNFTVANYHTYYVSELNILVHNSNPCANQSVKYLTYNTGNFAKNLELRTGKKVANSQAHHVFPQTSEFTGFFNSKKIDIHDPKYGEWWESASHNKNWYNYNKAWKEFINSPQGEKASTTDVLDFGRGLMNKYGFKVSF